MTKNLIRVLLDWDDKSEMYTRLALSLIPIMFVTSMIFNNVYHSPKIGAMLIFTLMIIGIWLMIRRSKIDSKQPTIEVVN